MIARVVSVKTAKTATVLVTGTKTHPLYKKSYVFSKRYLVEDPLGVQLGQVVDIKPSKPVSKNKHFVITKVVGRDIEAVVTEQLKELAEQAIEEVMPEEPAESMDQQNQSISKSEEAADNADTPKTDKQKRRPRKEPK